MASITEIIRDTAGDVRDALLSRATKQTPPEAINEHLDHATDMAAKAVGRSALATVASGFGKGLLLTALAVMGGMALFGGLAATAGPDMLIVGGEAVTSFAGGLVAGAMKGLSILLQGAGPVALLAGGTLGAVMETRSRQNEISAEMAQLQAQNFALARQLGGKGPEQAMPAVPEASAAAQPEASMENIAQSIESCGHCARILEQRARSADAGRAHG